MKKGNYSLVILFLILFLTSCSSNSIKSVKNEGEFLKSNPENKTIKYEIKATGGFSSSIDFDLKEGKVDWEILNSKSEIIFKGYVINENGTTYRELTYPTKYLDGTLNQKKEVKDNIDSNANKIIAPDFPYLQFEVGSISGIYTLSLKPTNTDGKYTVMWSDRLPKK